MPNIGQKTITMSGQKLRDLEEKYKNEKRNRPAISFSAFIAESALMELERRQLIREAQFISLVGWNNDVITLKDVRNREKFVEVQIKEKKIKCLTDDDLGCIHVGFVSALPEVRKLLIEK